MRKKGNRLSHQNSVKFHISIASRAVFISLDILRSRKAFKGFLQNTYPMLEQSYLNTKTRFYTDESFLSYFVSKMILLNILQNVATYLFEYFVSHIAVIH